MHSPVGNFRELVRALEAGSVPPDHVVTWLHDGCARFATGDATSLDSALGLRRQGIELPARTYARQTRDAALAAAFVYVDGRSYWARVCELSRQIRAFESRVWPRVCRYRTPPGRLTSLQTQLFYAFEATDQVPASPSRLSEILRSNRAFSS